MYAKKFYLFKITLSLQWVEYIIAVAKFGSFACFGVAMESAASKCANERWPLLCPRGMVHNVCI
jgi:hypothetical protein